MSLLAYFDWLHAFAGLLVGLLVGLTGVGGGSLMTPLLVLLFGVNPQTAVGTDLLFASLTKIVGSGVHGWRDTVEWKVVRRLAFGSIPAAVATLAAMALIGQVGQSTQHVILFALASLLALTSVTVLLRNWLIRFAADLDPVQPPARVITGTVVLGAVMGVAVSLSSVGAGAIGVTVLLILYPRLPVVRVVGSDIAHAVPLTFVAGVGHWIIGDVNFVLLADLLIGSIPGVIIGSMLSTRAPERVLKPLLAGVLALSSWQLFVKASSPGKAVKPIAPIEAPARVSARVDGK